MAYDATSGELRDYIRFLIGDTGSTEIFSDDEYAMIISRIGSDENAIAGTMLMNLAASQARIATLIKTGRGDYSNDRKKVPEELRAAAKVFFDKADDFPHGKEVYLEDGDAKYIESMGDNQFNFDTRNTELNN